MERIDKILNNKLFLYHLNKNNMAEADRRFCHHNITHFLDVARIGMILNLEEELFISKEWIYAAALLHDIGKYMQYEEGIPHEEASARLAPEILQECGFKKEEITVIVDAIQGHREDTSAALKNLKGILYRADKASRACFACKAQADCNWKADKKNLQIKY
ncbi:MAG: HD domain-containing protein [Lachnospiraceae bacterium]|nr:HD domain-containing protein [Lachnospiraceae bacterium]